MATVNKVCVNAIIKELGELDCRIILIFEDGSEKELLTPMSLETAIEVQKLFRKH